MEVKWQKWRSLLFQTYEVRFSIQREFEIIRDNIYTVATGTGFSVGMRNLKHASHCYQLRYVIETDVYSFQPSIYSSLREKRYQSGEVSSLAFAVFHMNIK